MILRELLIQYEMQNDLSHSEMANQIGVSLSTYYRWINGESTKLKKRPSKSLYRPPKVRPKSLTNGDRYFYV